MEIKEHKFLSSWSGKTLERKINALTSQGFVIVWRYQTFKHCCWLSKHEQSIAQIGNDEIDNSIDWRK